MKLKIGTTHIVCIMLVQLIIIDAFLIAFFVKKLNSKPISSTGAVVNLHLSKAAKTASTNKNTKKFSVLEDFIKRFGLDKQEVRDFRIPVRHDGMKNFVATAYDLSYESCGKYPSHPEYGITYSGKPAVRGRTVAVDPEVIPLGSRVYIEFSKEYMIFNGWYIAEDTGSKVRGNIIDIFLGKSALDEARKFGRRRISVKIIYPDGNIG